MKLKNIFTNVCGIHDTFTIRPMTWGVGGKTTSQHTKSQKTHRDVYTSITLFKDVHLNQQDQVSLKSKLLIYELRK